MFIDENGCGPISCRWLVDRVSNLGAHANSYEIEVRRVIPGIEKIRDDSVMNRHERLLKLDHVLATAILAVDSATHVQPQLVDARPINGCRDALQDVRHGLDIGAKRRSIKLLSNRPSVRKLGWIGLEAAVDLHLPEASAGRMAVTRTENHRRSHPCRTEERTPSHRFHVWTSKSAALIKSTGLQVRIGLRSPKGIPK